MDEFIKYQEFPDLELASSLIDLLEENKIPYQVDNSAARFQIIGSVGSQLDQVIVEIRESDFEKVNLLLSSQEKENIDQEYYLYSFSDEDIIDVIANPDEWTESDVKLANKISKQRGLKLTAESIKSARKEKITENDKKKKIAKNKVQFACSWFLWIALFSIFNSISIILPKRSFIGGGLGLTKIIEEIFKNASDYSTAIDITVNIIISCVFILFWYYAKKKKQWAFILGMIIYGLDTIIFISSKEWATTGFRLFILLIIYVGYDTLFIKKEKIAD